MKLHLSFKYFMNFSVVVYHVCSEKKNKYISFHDGENCVVEDDDNTENDEYFIDNVIV